MNKNQNNVIVSNPGGTGPDIDTLNKLLSEFMKKSEMDNLMERLEKVEKKAEEAKDGVKK